MMKNNVLTIVNSANMNIGVLIYFLIIALSVYKPRIGIAGSHGGSIFYEETLYCFPW